MRRRASCAENEVEDVDFFVDFPASKIKLIKYIESLWGKNANSLKQMCSFPSCFMVGNYIEWWRVGEERFFPRDCPSSVCIYFSPLSLLFSLHKFSGKRKCR